MTPLEIWMAVESNVKERLENGDGFWRSCSGCYETEDGQNVHGYPHSNVFGCTLGGGCSECGGIGAIWDATDYGAMADGILAADATSAATLRPDAVREAAKKALRWFEMANDGDMAMASMRDAEAIEAELQAALAAAPQAQEGETRTAHLIQQLAWYYDVNDCCDRPNGDALEVPIVDLCEAKRIALALNLPTGPGYGESPHSRPLQRGGE